MDGNTSKPWLIHGSRSLVHRVCSFDDGDYFAGMSLLALASIV